MSTSSTVVSAVHRRGGVAHTGALQREGHSRHHLGQTIASGGLHRIRRGWVAAPGADAELVWAAQHGVVLSCITQARRLHLWVLREAGAHAAVAPHAQVRSSPHATIHWAEPPVPRAPGVLVDPIENVLALVAACQPPELALAVWESALNKELVSAEALGRLALPAAARALLAEASPLADSGLETLFRTRLRWLRVRIIAQAWIAGHRVDFLIGRRLVVQIDGGHHVGRQRAADIAHDAALTLRGYHVLRFTYAQIVDDWPGVQDVIAAAIAQGLHR